MSKYFEKSENRVIFRKNIRFFFGRKFENLKKKISKSQNLKKVENFQNFEKISKSENLENFEKKSRFFSEKKIVCIVC